MGVPAKYRNVSEQAIATYNYTDIANGTGVAVFYCAQETDSTGTGQFLTASTIIKPDPATIVNIASAGGQDNTYVFDVAFNLPRIINGDLYVNVAYNLIKAGSSAGGSFTVTATAAHYDGSTATTIGAAVTSPTEVPSVTLKTDVFLLKIPNTTRVHFKKGEILRLSIQMVTVQATSDATTSTLFTDPTLGVDNQTKILVPFDLDL